MPRPFLGWFCTRSLKDFAIFTPKKNSIEENNLNNNRERPSKNSETYKKSTNIQKSRKHGRYLEFTSPIKCTNYFYIIQRNTNDMGFDGDSVPPVAKNGQNPTNNNLSIILQKDEQKDYHFSV